MPSKYQRRSILCGISVVLFSGCVGEDNSEDGICTFSTEESFSTDNIVALSYKGDNIERETDNGTINDFRISGTFEINPEYIKQIVIKDHNERVIETVSVTEEKTEVTWFVGSDRPTGDRFEIVANNYDNEIDGSYIQAECEGN